jgi:hypothetical protein
MIKGTLAGVIGTGILVSGVSPAYTDDCVDRTLKFGIVETQGCFTQVGARYDTTDPFMFNGFNVDPRGQKVSFSTDSITTNSAFVAFSATHPRFGKALFNNVKFAFRPPTSGEMILTDNAADVSYMSLLGVTPLGVKQPITLKDGKASFDLSFDLGGFFGTLMAKTDKKIAATIGMEVEKGQFTIAKGKFGVSDFEIGELIKVNDMAFEFEPPEEIAADFDGGFPQFSSISFIGGIGLGAGPKIKYARFGVGDLNKPLGTSGVYLQKMIAQITPFPPYGAGGQVTMTVGPKVRFLGRDVSAVEADGKIEIRGADTKNKKVGYFTTTGDFKLMTLPVANAAFTYWFGQGTAFSASVGIGLPSGKNDPGQPTYVGGGFKGWTTARNFDLEGDARFKLLGIDLLGAKTVVSDYGMAGCVQIAVWVGGGVRWSDGQGEMLGGFSCDVGKYQRRPQAMQAAGDGRGHLSLDSDDQIVRIIGEDDAPQVVLTEGEREISSPTPDDPDGIQEDDDGTSFTTETATVFVLDDPEGDWRLKTGPGEVGTIETASPLPDHEVQAWVTGKGRKRVLHWNARKIPYQRLSFSEVLPGGGEVPILSTRKASGKHRFTAAKGAWGKKRKLTVDVTQRYNTPRDSLVADTFRVRRAAAPKAVTGLRAQRLVDEVVVRFKPSRRAAMYIVDATPAGSGAVYRSEVSKPRARMAIGVTDTMRVRVVPVNGQGRRGPARVVRLDTEDIVASPEVAAREAAERARVVGPRRVATLVECPQGEHCDVTVVVRRDGRVIGRTSTMLPPDMAQRIVVRTSRPAAGSDITVRVSARD